MKKIGFGGGCHWCTEAVFQAFDGVSNVAQGWIQSKPPFDSYSEAVIVQYDPNKIILQLLIEAHLLTHSSSSDHAMRNKYRSAVYYLSDDDKIISEQIIQQLTKQHHQNFVTRILPMVAFKSNMEKYLNYFKNNIKAPFCQNHIAPKIKKLEEYYNGKINQFSLEQ